MNIHTLGEENNQSDRQHGTFNSENSNNNGYTVPEENREPTESHSSLIRQRKTFKAFCSIILMIDLAVFIAQELVFKIKYKSKNWSCLCYKFGAKYTPAIKAHYEYYRLLTPMFLHDNIGHILSNSLSIFFIGFYVESIIGTKIFAVFYFLAGLTGNLLSAIFNKNSLSVGASTCGMGVSGLLLVIYSTRIRTMTNEGILDFLVYAGITLANAFNIRPNIDSFGHIGGFMFGLAASPFLIENKGLGNLIGPGGIKKLKIICGIFLILVYTLGFGNLIFTKLPPNTLTKIC